ncbi:hypothetical protein ACFL6M_07300, partial [Candidatus Eisenbacteria bacterium]
GWAPLRSMVTSDWQYIEVPRAELYHLQTDPAQEVNVIEEFPDVAKRMREELLTLTAEMEPPATTTETLDPETRRQLESLGYIGGSHCPIPRTCTMCIFSTVRQPVRSVAGNSPKRSGSSNLLS